MGEVQDIIEELKEELLEHPLIDEVFNLTEKKDVIRKEIDDRIVSYFKPITHCVV